MKVKLNITPLCIFILLLTGCESSSNKVPVQTGFSDDDESLPADLFQLSTPTVTSDGLSVMQLPDGRQFYQGDILIPDRAPTVCDRSAEDTDPGNGVSSQYACLNVTLSGNLWPGSMPIKLDPELPAVVVEKVNDARDLLEAQTGLLLPTWSNEANYVEVVLSPPSEPSFSRGIGMQGGPQIVSLRTDAPFGTMLHELMHAAGAFHEHARSDRDMWLTVSIENIRPDGLDNFEIDSFSSPRGDYDYNSIMHYGMFGFGLCGGGSMPNELSGCQGIPDNLLCPDGSRTNSRNVCPTNVPSQIVPVVAITCVAGKYFCDDSGEVSSAPLGQGQRVGMSPIDIAQLRQVYKDTTLTINLDLELGGHLVAPDLLLDGEVLVREIGSAGLRFALGPYQQEVGLHSLSISGGSDRPSNRNTYTFGGDCNEDGSYSLRRKEKIVCTLTLRRDPVSTAVLISPIGEATAITPTFSWNKVVAPFVDSYEFQLLDSSGLILFEEEFEQLDVCFGGDLCSIDGIDVNFEPGTFYKWSIRADNGVTDVGSMLYAPWSRSVEFKYLPMTFSAEMVR